MNYPKFILASASPRRKELLDQAGLSFIIVPANIDEGQILGEAPLDYVARVALLKARAVNDQDMPVLAADTIVFVDRDILGKPKNEKEAIEMLSFLSGKTHKVATAFTLIGKDKKEEKSQIVISAVSFRKLSTWEIENYLALGESLDKAGAYSIQGSGGFLVSSISGSFTNIVGLPLLEVLEALKHTSL